MAPPPYFEQKVDALFTMCQALVVHLHFTAEHHGTPYVQGCPVPICQTWMDQFHRYVFGPPDPEGSDDGEDLALAAEEPA